MGCVIDMVFGGVHGISQYLYVCCICLLIVACVLIMFVDWLCTSVA